MTVRTKEGQYSERVDFPKGEPENPLTEKEFRERYNGLMDYAGVRQADSDEVYESVRNRNVLIHEIVRKL